MSNTYRATSVYGKAIFGEANFEQEFTPANEGDHLSAGHLEIVPRTYRVLSNNFAAAEQGETLELALLVEHEAALILGGHIERVDASPKPAKKTSPKKED